MRLRIFCIYFSHPGRTHRAWVLYPALPRAAAVYLYALCIVLYGLIDAAVLFFVCLSACLVV